MSSMQTPTSALSHSSPPTRFSTHPSISASTHPSIHLCAPPSKPPSPSHPPSHQASLSLQAKLIFSSRRQPRAYLLRVELSKSYLYWRVTRMCPKLLAPQSSSSQEMSDFLLLPSCVQVYSNSCEPSFQGSCRPHPLASISFLHHSASHHLPLMRTLTSASSLSFLLLPLFPYPHSR